MNKLNQLVTEITNLGSTSVQDATLCAFTYLELQKRKDAALVDEISYHYNAQIGKLYCQALTVKTGKMCVYIPISSSFALEYQTWEDYFSLIPEEIGTNSLILAIWEADSTHVFYEITKGLGSPPRAQKRKKPKKRRNKKKVNIAKDTEEPSTSTSTKRKIEEV